MGYLPMTARTLVLSPVRITTALASPSSAAIARRRFSAEDFAPGDAKEGVDPIGPSLYRFVGSMLARDSENFATSSVLYDRCTRIAEGGRFATERPERHSRAGRIGRATKPPPQFGQTFWSLSRAQVSQNVHS
jgi:hypothetical protein